MAESYTKVEMHYITGFLAAKNGKCLSEDLDHKLLHKFKDVVEKDVAL
jgi:hypothetical protein